MAPTSSVTPCVSVVGLPPHRHAWHTYTWEGAPLTKPVILTHRNDAKVAIGYPYYGPVEHPFMVSMLNLWRYDALGARTPEGKKVGGRGHILDGGAHIPRTTALLVRARTDIVTDFLALESKPEWLFMVDTDMTFDPDVVDRFIAAAHPTQRPIVGGLAFSYMQGDAHKFWPTLFEYVPGSDRFRRLTEYPANALVPVGATGAACLFVHRTVFEAMRDKYGTARPWFAETLTDDDVLSEDITFCLRAQACGFPVHVHTGIKFGHIKNFSADEAAFLEECSRLAEAAKPAMPTYAVVASKNRPEMLATLVRQLAPQATTFVFDNGYDTSPVPDAIDAHGWPLHRMWNVGLDLAAEDAAGKPHNVLIINDDVEVADDVCARLENGLRHDNNIWVTYPHPQLPPGNAAEFDNPTLANQTLTGWCFMLRGEAGLRFDEQYEWWYGDSDLEKQVRAAGGHVVGVGGVGVNHLDPMRSTTDPDRLEQAKADEKRFATKWGIDPDALWLAQHPEFGQ